MSSSEENKHTVLGDKTADFESVEDSKKARIDEEELTKSDNQATSELEKNDKNEETTGEESKKTLKQSQIDKYFVVSKKTSNKKEYDDDFITDDEDKHENKDDVNRVKNLRDEIHGEDRTENNPKLNKYPGLFNEFDDTIQYRLNPELTSPNDPELNANVRFFRNEIKSRPFGYKITKFHQDFYGNYDFLESDHNFIQWLFPNRAQGLNYDSQPLQLHELETLKNDDEAKSRLLISFQMMLDFYGMKMDEFHQIKRNRAYKDRYENLLRRMHNNLRITRILKCLGDFELTEYQINFLKFLKDEIFVHKTLAKLAKTYTNFWIHTIKNDQDRENLKNEVVTLILSN